MRALRTIAELREALEPLRVRFSVGLVPTMGAFHDGHLSLFAAAREENEAVVVSLFVNPAQFGSAEDLASYPRDVAQDEAIATAAGVDFLFMPSVEELYPAGFQTWVDVDEISQKLEGEHRPGHFRGVATVCLKLFNIVRPQRAYFGRKDAQQAALVKRLVHDLNLEVEIRVLPTVREADGLALSSRNAHLSPEERTRALALPRALEAGAKAFREGRDPVNAARATLNGLDPDYVDVLELDGQRLLAAAVRVGHTRLIDNVPLKGAK
jgi:pantoate--beta-alanine ligase